MARKVRLTLVALMFSLSSIFASGFQINEHGARAMAMGGAFTGLANDVSALFYNPAGLVNLKGTHLVAGVTLISPKAAFRGPAPEITEYSVKDNLFTPINIYATHQINDDLAVGLSVNNPYGLGTEWPEDWVGNKLAVDTEIRTFFFTPTISYRLTDNLSIGAGLVFAYGDVTIARKTSLYPFEGEAMVSLEGDGTAWGFTGGLLYQPLKELSLGVSFRSSATFNFEGDATTKGGPSQLEGSLPKGGIAAELTTPMNVTFGVAVFPMNELTLTADFQYVGWSSYDKLAIDFTDPNLDDLSAKRDYNNSFIVRFGAEYWLSSDFALRGGLLYDKNPVDDERVEPTLPDADRLGFNIGFGYNLTEALSVDIAYLFLRFAEREITNSLENYAEGNTPFNGVYNSSAHLFGINFSYNFN
ncbi:MAG: outer membrane protein transport protein [Melioribacteraceae bacterium]|nr:outer membrane protein transport protein [Melioribacteraceae bacterium]MCF8352940.1 outer membrane protein transport protein [Melioribacteraceae bacterium]MCF8395876.1 outer membrane protein transport protein [Melioribacteraceae bacterium]MCF8417457.1 outer membrane protein transport protein [Melioribacteraceae bacterium]